VFLGNVVNPGKIPLLTNNPGIIPTLNFGDFWFVLVKFCEVCADFGYILRFCAYF
jgi:hypothetical protein